VGMRAASAYPKYFRPLPRANGTRNRVPTRLRKGTSAVKVRVPRITRFGSSRAGRTARYRQDGAGRRHPRDTPCNRESAQRIVDAGFQRRLAQIYRVPHSRLRNCPARRKISRYSGRCIVHHYNSGDSFPKARRSVGAGSPGDMRNDHRQTTVSAGIGDAVSAMSPDRASTVRFTYSTGIASAGLCNLNHGMRIGLLLLAWPCASPADSGKRDPRAVWSRPFRRRRPRQAPQRAFTGVYMKPADEYGRPSANWRACFRTAILN